MDPKPIRYALVIAAAISVGCHPAGPDRNFRFAELPITYSAVTHLAEINGCYTSAGLQYSSVALPAGPDVTNALRSIAPSAPQAGGIATTPVMTMIAAGYHPVILATTLQSNRQVKLVTRAASGITDNANTLRSRRVGVTRNTNGDIYLSRLLKKGGLSEADVSVVSGRPADLSSLLVQGKIDAAVLWDPYVIDTVRKLSAASGQVPRNAGAKVFVDPTLHTLAFNIVTTSTRLGNNRELLLKVLQGAICAERYIRDDRAGAQRAVEQWLRLDAGDLDDFFATTEFRVQLNRSQMATWLRQELEWLGERGQAVSMPNDLLPYIDASLLKSIDTSRVTER